MLQVPEHRAQCVQVPEGSRRRGQAPDGTCPFLLEGNQVDNRRRDVDITDVSLDNAVMCAARVVCMAGQAVSLDASFDSGADQSVVPPSTLGEAEEAGPRHRRDQAEGTYQ
ncbi:hypothetical protein As57867_005319, partial [Aphanomyces stellatus]